ncbi:hypothetical protein HRI_001753100 [Hibiscus trionum]|uniref:Uncharacterized protein n=1 Tax=Hibiscus trionum TaxID=183268 RepID=A0A9W7LY93_HIBTR|nr:hypothetical protein HRI_001753100 [Hibiscus trionum]
MIEVEDVAEVAGAIEAVVEEEATVVDKKKMKKEATTMHAEEDVVEAEMADQIGTMLIVTTVENTVTMQKSAMSKRRWTRM